MDQNQLDQGTVEEIKDINPNEYDLSTLIGVGVYSKIKLCKKKSTSKYFVMKMLRKSDLIKEKQIDHVYSEYNIMTKLNHPFISKVKGKYFNDPMYIYYLFEYIPGGDLYHLLKIKHHLSLDHTKFYLAHAVSALDYIHSKNIVYRDLKPENLLIGQNGYLKLTDFGLSKELKEGITYTICGTPQYIAPEIILGKGHSFSVDWWSLGILLFEMLTGEPPFNDEEGDAMVIYEKIVKSKLNIPTTIDKTSKHLIKKLLKVDSNKRYGCLNGKVKDIVNHPFFEGFDWRSFIFCKMQAPFIPFLKTQNDTSNFDKLTDDIEDPSPVSQTEDVFKNWK